MAPFHSILIVTIINSSKIKLQLYLALSVVMHKLKWHHFQEACYSSCLDALQLLTETKQLATCVVDEESNDFWPDSRITSPLNLFFIRISIFHKNVWLPPAFREEANDKILTTAPRSWCLWRSLKSYSHILEIRTILSVAHNKHIKKKKIDGMGPL